MFRPAIWLGMLGVALLLLVSPVYFGAVVLGAAIGVAVADRERRAGGAGCARGGAADVNAPPPLKIAPVTRRRPRLRSGHVLGAAGAPTDAVT